MLVKEGKAVYPLQFSRVQLGENVIYARGGRGRSWFILDYIDDRLFVPADADCVKLADGETLYGYDRRAAIN